MKFLGSLLYLFIAHTSTSLGSEPRASGPGSATDTNCSVQFAALTPPTPSSAAPSGAAGSAAARGDRAMSKASQKKVEEELFAMKQAIDRDIDDARLDSITKGAGQTIVITPGNEFKASLNRVSTSVRAELASQGFEFRSVRKKVFRLAGDGVVLDIPEREVFEISVGRAKGPIAREMSRIQKYFSESLKRQGLPDSEFKIYFDPAIMGVLQTHGLFSNSADLGKGMHIGGRGLLYDENFVVELLRHELRHAKAYFDVLAGAPTLNRGTLMDESQGRLLENTSGGPDAISYSYSRKFSFDEIDAFFANVATNQGILRRQSTSGANPETLRNTKLRALQRAKSVRGFVEASRDNLGKVRSTLQTARTPEAWSAITSIRTDPNYPGVRELTVRFRADPRNPRSAERKLVLLLPAEVADQGPTAQMADVRQYVEDMTLKLFDVEKELAIRERQINSYTTP